MIKEVFTEHPASVGETYTEHFGQAMSFAGALFHASCACFIHGLFPFLMTKTGSEIIKTLHQRMVTHRAEQPPHGKLKPAKSGV